MSHRKDVPRWPGRLRVAGAALLAVLVLLLLAYLLGRLL